MTEAQLILEVEERCDYCGPLSWTERSYGRITHKHNCPSRNDVFCQAHPAMCGEPVKPVVNPHWPLRELPGTTWEDIFEATA